MLILADMDGVLCDFDAAFFERWRARHPERDYVHPENRRHFYLDDDYDESERDRIYEIIEEEGFFASLPVIEGALSALYGMEAAGHEVFICTAPLSAWHNCVAEKFGWIDAKLGHAWTKRIILTKDKTLIHGDVLIDDKPVVAGVQEPYFEHLVFERPYNRDAVGRRINWTNWRQILAEVEHERAARAA